MDTPRSLLGAGQIKKRTFDEENAALRVILSSATEMQVDLRAEDGDSVLTVSKQTSATGIDGVAEFDVSGVNTLAIYTKQTGTAPNAKLEISPTETGDTWFLLRDLTPGCTGAIQIAASRARVTQDSKSEANPGSGEYWAVGNG